MNVESDHTSKSKDRSKKFKNNGRRRRAAPTVQLTLALNDVRKQLVLNCCNLRLDHAVKVQLTATREPQVFAGFASDFGYTEPSIEAISTISEG